MWMLEEFGEPYELVETSAHPDDLWTAAYLRLNPTAHIAESIAAPTLFWPEFLHSLDP